MEENNKIRSMEIEINGKGNEKELLKMLAWIEWCGNVGHTPKYLKTYIDGDGSTRWKFKFKDKEKQNEYEEIRHSMTKNHDKNGKDLEYVEL